MGGGGEPAPERIGIMAKPFDPLSGAALEMKPYEQYGILIGLLDVMSVKYAANAQNRYNQGIYLTMSQKYPNLMQVDPMQFARQCLDHLPDRVKTSLVAQREMMDQIIALMANLAELPKSEPDGIWLHYYYRTRNMLHPATVGLRIREAREKAGLTQQQLANSLGITNRQRANQWESGYRTPSAKTMERIAEVLGASAGWLMFGE